MDVTETLKLLLHGNQLKRTVRTGWYQRGITDAENVAAHSYGVAFIALAVAHALPERVDVQRVLAMALLHDLPEGLTSDIPSPAWRLLPDATKENVERDAMYAIVGAYPSGDTFLSYWEELQANRTLEARLVHDSDKLDMYLQAYFYELHTGNRQLAEFWEGEHNFAFEETRSLFDEIISLREVE